MIKLFFILFFSSLVSFLGSLQVGPIHLCIIDTTLNQNRKKALVVVLGACIPEFFYCAAAVYTEILLVNNYIVFFIMKILLILLLIIMGLIYLFKKNNAKGTFVSNEKIKSSYTNNFFKGFFLSALNPQILPFWLLIMAYFNSISFLKIKSVSDRIAFIIGAGFGAFLLFIAMIFLLIKFKDKFLAYLNHKMYYKVLAILFFLIALEQLITLF